MPEVPPLTEAANPRTAAIDRASTEDVLRLMNDEDARVAGAVRAEIPRIARALDAIVKRWERGGRLFYCGAGTSGRLGVLDAAECPPTFGTPPDRVQAVIAGGPPALLQAVEGAEDSPAEGRAGLRSRGLASGDALVGIAASGQTPFVLGAIDYATEIGAATVGLSCSPGSALERSVRYPITPRVGPEVVAGSTRLKSGTAQKLVLNMLSTGLMVRTGCVLGNLMVNVLVRNDKLARRAERIICQVSGCETTEARQALASAGNDVRLAILMRVHGIDAPTATSRLSEHGGNLRRALLSGRDRPVTGNNL